MPTVQPAMTLADSREESGVALSVRGVTKAYPGVLALADVSLELYAGSIHALVGENGAGKSSLVKVITGAIAPDEGKIAIDGAELSQLTPSTARAFGISVIQQERQIAFDLSIAENVLLGRLPYRMGAVSWRRARQQARERLATLGRDIDVRRPVRDLPVAELQELEIARALSAEVRVLVMDEPTSALSRAEVDKLFETIRRLRDSGAAILYISHHLDEIFQIADTVTVMRDGTTVATKPIERLDKEQLVRLMLGRELDAIVENAPTAQPRRDETPVLQATDVWHPPGLQGVTLEVHGGEVLCVTGTVGSGRRELARCLAGVARPASGTVTMGGHRLSGPRDALRRGVAFVPEDRKREGLLLELPVADNIAIEAVASGRNPLVFARSRAREARALVKRLGIRTRSVNTPVRLLSGGNQQKVVVARSLNVGARAFVFDEPTAGVDVGSKMEIYALLRDLASAGAAIVVFSSDFEEIKLLADRAVVLHRGTVARELSGEALSEDQLLSLSLGGS